MASLKQLEGKLSKAEIRKTELVAELEQVKVELSEKQSGLGDQVLSGGNAEKLSGEILKLERHEQALTLGVERANDAIQSLKSDVAALAADEARTEMVKLEKEVRGRVVDFIRALVLANDASDQVKEVYRRAVSLAGDHEGLSESQFGFGEYLAISRAVRDERIVKLRQFETGHPNLFREATKK